MTACQLGWMVMCNLICELNFAIIFDLSFLGLHFSSAFSVFLIDRCHRHSVVVTEVRCMHQNTRSYP